MPSSSTKQRNYILYLRGKYKTKKNTPKDQEWIWNNDWLTIRESSFRSEVKAWIDPEGNYLPFHRLKNHDDMLPLGLRYGDALRKGWIRLYKTPDRIHITCDRFDAKEIKCCMKVFSQEEELKSIPIVVALGSKVINYNPLFKEGQEIMKQYTRFFEEEQENSLSELTDDTIPEKIVDFIIKNPFPKDHTQIHSFAEGLGIEPDKFEQYVYAFLTVILTGGKSKGDTSKISKEQLDIGMKIEREHVETGIDNKVVKTIEDIFKKKISSDHDAEDNTYYQGSVNFKDELKQENK